MEKKLTEGSVFKALLFFSLPYLLSYFLQTLYGMADLFIIGQYNGVDSTTAVSVGSQVMNMFTVMIVGLAMGATVMIGRCVGSNDYKQMAKVIGNTVTFFMGFSIVLTVVLLFFVENIVSIVSTPKEAVSGTITYLIICFMGIPFIVAYNIISSIFRGMGDSKSPMYFIAVACAVNIIVDYIFIGVLKIGPAGAALGTVLSQAISVVVSLTVILKRKSGVKLTKSDFKPQKNVLRNVLKIGIPISLQDGFIQVSFIIITIIANKRGLNDSAAVGIVEKIIGILFLVPSSMLSSVSALSAQNIGAGKHNRASLTLRYAILITASFGIVMAILVQFTAGYAVGLFTNNSYVIALGDEYLRSYVWDCAIAGIHFSFSGYFYAYGMSFISFTHNLLSIVCVRIPFSYLLSKMYTDTLFPMGIASPAGSVLSVIICVIAFIWFRKNNKIKTM